MRRVLLRSFLLAGAVALNCLAQPFFLRNDIMVGQNPTDAVAGDFNGDGRTDLAISTEEGIFVLLNTGNGKFERSAKTEAPAWIYLMPAAADFNGDGKDDLVGSGLLFLSRGDGTFLPGRPIGDQEAVATADFNSDGKMDLLIADGKWTDAGFITHGVRVLLGNGDGTFHSGVQVTAYAAAQIRVADFNRDGRTDVAMLPVINMYPELIPEARSSTLLVFLGQGDGSFGPEIRTTVQGTSDSSSLSAFLIADFNGDKVPDVFTASGIRFGIGNGNFKSPVAYVADVPGFPVAATDLTGDGYADLIMAYEASAIAICQGKGDGTMLPAIEQSVSWGFAYPYSLIPVDLNGDGRLDLVTVNPALNSVSVLLGRAEGGAALRRAVSAAVDIAIVAPGSLATLYAPSPAETTTATPPWPATLDGVILQLQEQDGWTWQVPLLYVSPMQINFQVPEEVALGEAKLTIGTHNGPFEAGSAHVDAAAPSFFLMSASGMVPAATAVRVEPDGTQVAVPVFECSPELGCGLVPIPLSTAGDRPIYVSFYGTGFNKAKADDVTCTINGVELPVSYVGPQATPGMDQVNIRLVPEVLQAAEFWWWGESMATVTIRVGGVPANSLYLLID
jgi:uncharacterized protein (TIGR03437 family)